MDSQKWIWCCNIGQYDYSPIWLTTMQKMIRGSPIRLRLIGNFIPHVEPADARIPRIRIGTHLF